MFNIIYKYTDKIALYTNFDYKDDGDISHTSLGDMIGINEASVRNNLERIEDAQINSATYNIRENMYIKLKAGVRRSFGFSQLSEIKNLMDGAITKFAIKKWGEVPFTMELRAIFSTYAAPIGKEDFSVFSEPTLSEALGRWQNYINKVKQKGTTPKEKTDKYFRLTTLISLIDDTKVRPYNDGNIDKIKEECLNIIFREMIDTSLISSEDMRPLFDLTNQILTTLTIATKPRSVNNRQKVYSLTDLSRIASKQGKRYLFFQKFKFGYQLKHPQGNRIKAELRKHYFTSARAQIDETILAIKETFRKHELKYHKYFKNDLYIPQIYELFSITLGLDVSSQDFIEDATDSQGSGKYNIDASRHHPQENKDAYTIFDVDQLGLLVNLIPLTRSSHASIGNFLRSGLTIENQLAVARFLHLYELIQRPYEAGIDYEAEFLREFNSKTAVVYEGNEMSNRKLWDKFDQEKIERYVDSWIEMKENPSESIFDDNKFFSKRYPKWYFNTFKPDINQFYLFLQKNPNTERPDFWHWYLNTYLREDFHPFYDDPFS